MFNVRLAGVNLYKKLLFTWLSLVMALMASYFVLSFFPHEMSWMRSRIELSQLLRLFLLTFNKAQQQLLLYNKSNLVVTPQTHPLGALSITVSLYLFKYSIILLV